MVAHIKQWSLTPDLSVRNFKTAALTRRATTNTAGDLPLRIQTRSVVSSKATPRRNATNPHACKFAFFSTVSHQDGFHPWALLRDTACLLLGRMALGIPSVAPPYIAEYKSTGQDSPTRLGTASALQGTLSTEFVQSIPMRLGAVTLTYFLRVRNLFFKLVHQHLLPTLRHTALTPVADYVLLYVQHIGQSAYPASRFDCYF